MPPDLPLLHVDDSLVVVDKPAGLPSVPAPGDAPSVWRTLEAQLGCRLWAVHRLDKEASGVLLFARNADAHRVLSGLFAARQVDKTYLALTAGLPSPPEGAVSTPLHEARRGRMRPAVPGEAGSLDATTVYRTREVWARPGTGVALVEAMPRTGRHHQIRVHFRSLGVPLLFDRSYGARQPPAWLSGAPARRLALHACRLVLPFPEGSESLRIESALPGDLAALVEWLRSVAEPARP